MAAYPVRTVRTGRCRPCGTAVVRHRYLLVKQKAYQPRLDVWRPRQQGLPEGAEDPAQVAEGVMIKMIHAL